MLANRNKQQNTQDIRFDAPDTFQEPILEAFIYNNLLLNELRVYGDKSAHDINIQQKERIENIMKSLNPNQSISSLCPNRVWACVIQTKNVDFLIAFMKFTHLHLQIDDQMLFFNDLPYQWLQGLVIVLPILLKRMTDSNMTDFIKYIVNIDPKLLFHVISSVHLDTEKALYLFNYVLEKQETWTNTKYNYDFIITVCFNRFLHQTDISDSFENIIRTNNYHLMAEIGTHSHDFAKRISSFVCESPDIFHMLLADLKYFPIITAHLENPTSYDQILRKYSEDEIALPIYGIVNHELKLHKDEAIAYNELVKETYYNELKHVFAEITCKIDTYIIIPKETTPIDLDNIYLGVLISESDTIRSRFGIKPTTALNILNSNFQDLKASLLNIKN